jgi:hypothetical protein
MVTVTVNGTEFTIEPAKSRATLLAALRLTRRSATIKLCLEKFSGPITDFASAAITFFEILAIEDDSIVDDVFHVLHLLSGIPLSEIENMPITQLVPFVVAVIRANDMEALFAASIRE